MEAWMIGLILGVIGTVGMIVLAVVTKKALRITFGVMAVAVALITVVVVGPDIPDIGEEPPDLDIEGESTADWQMISATDTQTHLVSWGDDDYKVLMDFNKTGNNFNSLTQFATVDYRFSNFGQDDGSGVIATITDYGNWYYSVTKTDYWIIEQDSDQKFSSNWTIDGSTAINQVDHVTFPSSTDTKLGQVILNLTANGNAVDLMTQSTSTAKVVVEFRNSISKELIGTVSYFYELTSINEP